jgi:hypothetical protein
MLNAKRFVPLEKQVKKPQAMAKSGLGSGLKLSKASRWDTALQVHGAFLVPAA